MIQDTRPTIHPNRSPLVSDYDSDSSTSNNDSIATQPRVMQTPPRVTPIRIITPCLRVSTTPSPPAYNTRTRVWSITQETILHLLHHTTNPLSAQQAAIRHYPSDILAAILDTDTSELIEYQHLIKNQKYCTTWKNAYGKELDHLAQGIPSTVQGTNTIEFISPNQIPPDCHKDITYGLICANY